MAEDEKAAGVALDVDPPLHRRLFAGDDRRDSDRPGAEAIDPATIVEADLEERGHAERAPTLASVDQYPQSAGAIAIVGIARDGKQLMERRVADGELGGEHAVHPCGRAERRSRRAAYRRRCAVARRGGGRRRAPCRAARHGGCNVSPGAKNDSKPPFAPLDMRATRVVRGDRRLVEGFGDQRGRVLQQAARRRRERDRARRPGRGGALDLVEPREIGVARCGRMIGFIEAEERPRRRLARRERRRAALQRRAGRLALQARRGQLGAERQCETTRRRDAPAP